MKYILIEKMKSGIMNKIRHTKKKKIQTVKETEENFIKSTPSGFYLQNKLVKSCEAFKLQFYSDLLIRFRFNLKICS